MQNAVKNLVERYLPIQPGEEVILVCDSNKEQFAIAVARAYMDRGCVPTIVRLPDTLPHESPFLRHLLENYDASFLLLPSAHTWSAQHLWTYLDFSMGPPRVKGKTHPCKLELMPLPSVLRLYASDIDADQAYLQTLKARLPEYTAMRVTAPGGTDLGFVSRSWIVQDWEILTAPVEESIEGRIVVDGSLFFAQVDETIEINIQRGMITSMTSAHGNNPLLVKYREFTGKEFEVEVNRQLAEVGIGGNSKAQFSGIIMEDEAIRGTCHFCFGNNSQYGGSNRSDWHGGTVVIRDPEFALKE